MDLFFLELPQIEIKWLIKECLHKFIDIFCLGLNITFDFKRGHKDGMTKNFAISPPLQLSTCMQAKFSNDKKNTRRQHKAGSFFEHLTSY